MIFASSRAWTSQVHAIIPEDNCVTTKEAFQRIADGIARFQRDVFPSQREMFGRLSRGQQPLAMFITCADSRLVPNLITQTEPGEIFIERNPGNMVPTFSEHVGGVTAGIEYANRVLKVPLIVVCGHADCGVMKALINPATTEDMPGLQTWMQYGSAARDRTMRDCADHTEAQRVNRLAAENVLEQIAHLKTHPSVAARLAAGEVKVCGWMYDIGSGMIWQADEAGTFKVFGE
jgi:carbonic anhydrase